jgi:hypothetical protein
MVGRSSLVWPGDSTNQLVTRRGPSNKGLLLARTGSVVGATRLAPRKSGGSLLSRNSIPKPFDR